MYWSVINTSWSLCHFALSWLVHQQVYFSNTTPFLDSSNQQYDVASVYIILLKRSEEYEYFKSRVKHKAPARLHTVLFALSAAIKFTSSICIYHQLWKLRSNGKLNTRRETQGSGWHVKKKYWGEVLTCWCLSR